MTSANPQEQTSLHVSVTVETPIEHAFGVFTERFDEIKPHEHNLLAVPIARTVLEPRVGGTIYDVGGGWQHLHLGPGARLRSAASAGVQLGHRPAVQIESDPNRTSEVEIRFVAEAPERTRVDLEHRHLDRHGEGWQALSGLDTGNGWPLYLQRFRAAAERSAARA